MLRWEQVANMNLHYRYYPLEDFLSAQERLGVRSIELWAGTPHLLLDDRGARNIDAVRARIRAHGLRTAVFTPEAVTYPYSLCAWDGEVLEKSLRYFENGIRAAAELGARTMTLALSGGARDEAPSSALARGARSLQVLSECAGKFGVTLAVRTLPSEESNVVNNLPALGNLLSAVASPWVKPALDLASAAAAGETPEQWFDFFGSDIAHIHFSDTRTSGHLAWGDGLLPLDDLTALLDERGYVGHMGQMLTREAYFFDPVGTDERSLAALRPYFCAEEERP